MAEELRCCFEDGDFGYAAYEGYGYRLDNNQNPGKAGVMNGNPDQCWLRGGDVALFKDGNEEKPYCLFHAPAEVEPIKPKGGWDIEKRGRMQAKRLCHHLDEWNAENESQDEDKKLAFVLPYMQCGNINLTGEWYKFNGSVAFNNAVFSGNVQFSGATFHRSVSFRNAIFKQIISFNTANFMGFVNFENVICDGAVFDKTELSKCRFDNAHLGHLTISNCTLAKPTAFQKCKIHKLKYDVHTGERLSFIDCKPLIDEKHLAEDAHWDFSSNDCSKLSFTSCNLSYADFRKSYIDDTHLITCDFRKSNDSEPYNKIYDDKKNIEDKKELEILGKTYTNLKRNLEKTGDYIQSGHFHFREMEMRQRFLEGKKKSFVERSILSFYRLIGDFGESYKKLGISLVASFFIMATLINLSEIASGGFKFDFNTGSYSDSSYFKYFEMLLFNMVPSSTSKEIIEGVSENLNPISKAFLIIEWIIAVTFAALFVMAVRRNFRR